MTRQYRRGLLVTAAALTLSSAAYAAHPAIPPGPPPSPPIAVPQTPVSTKVPVGPPGIAAEVNGQSIKTSVVAAKALQVAGPDVLQQLITFTLVDQAAKKAGIVITPKQIAASMQEVQLRIRMQMGGRSLQDLLAAQHESMADFKDGLRLKLEANALVDKTLPPVKLVHVRFILIATTKLGNTPGVNPHTPEEAQKIISNIQDQLKAGKSFSDLAKQYSEDESTKDKGGDIGIVSQNMSFDPAWLNAALALKPGEVSGVVKDEYGLNLIQCISTSAAPADAAEKAEYAAMAKAASEQSENQAIPALIQKLRSQARIVNYLAPQPPSNPMMPRPPMVPRRPLMPTPPRPMPMQPQPGAPAPPAAPGGPAPAPAAPAPAAPAPAAPAPAGAAPAGAAPMPPTPPAP